MTRLRTVNRRAKRRIWRWGRRAPFTGRWRFGKRWTPKTWPKPLSGNRGRTIVVDDMAYVATEEDRARVRVWWELDLLRRSIDEALNTFLAAIVAEALGGRR